MDPKEKTKVRKKQSKALSGIVSPANRCAGG